MSTIDRWNADEAEACESELRDTDTMPYYEDRAYNDCNNSLQNLAT